jgi:glycogen operon protein
VALRRRHIAFHRRRFFSSDPSRTDIHWLRPDGKEMAREDWDSGFARTLALWLRGAAHGYHVTAEGEPETDDDFFWILNAHDAAVDHRLPGDAAADPWQLVFDTSDERPPAAPVARRAGDAHAAGPRSVSLFVRRGSP